MEKNERLPWPARYAGPCRGRHVGVRDGMPQLRKACNSTRRLSRKRAFAFLLPPIPAAKPQRMRYVGATVTPHPQVEDASSSQGCKHHEWPRTMPGSLDKQARNKLGKRQCGSPVPKIRNVVHGSTAVPSPALCPHPPALRSTEHQIQQHLLP